MDFNGGIMWYQNHVIPQSFNQGSDKLKRPHLNKNNTPHTTYIAALKAVNR